MKIALVVTVKNEERLLKNNLLYHRFCGVDRVFVYFDGTTDRGKETLKNLDFVVLQDSVNADKYKNLEFLENFVKNAQEHHTARQCLNTYDAKCLAKSDGFDWLISLDADELIVTDLENISNLKEFFTQVHDEVDLVNFRTMEVLQQKKDYGNVFASADLFKTQKNFKQRGETIYKSIYNPSTKTSEKHHYWYGQTMGKAAIRVNSDLVPKNVHRYCTAKGEKPISINKGWILHYHAYDAEDFIKKFKNFSQHPNHFLSGNSVEPLKLLLRDVVNRHGYSDEQLTDYFCENLLFKPKEVDKLLRNNKFFVFIRKQKALKRVNSVINVFDHLKKTHISD